MLAKQEEPVLSSFSQPGSGGQRAASARGAGMAFPGGILIFRLAKHFLKEDQYGYQSH